MQASGMLDKLIDISGDDFREGPIIRKVAEPQFEGQTKNLEIENCISCKSGGKMIEIIWKKIK
jgi:DNA gyrase/topoisomerase IV subunit B